MSRSTLTRYAWLSIAAAITTMSFKVVTNQASHQDKELDR